MVSNALCIAQIVLYTLYLVRTPRRTRLGVAVAVSGILIGVGGLVIRNSRPSLLYAANFLAGVVFLLYLRNLYLQRKPTSDGKS